MRKLIIQTLVNQIQAMLAALSNQSITKQVEPMLTLIAHSRMYIIEAATFAEVSLEIV